MRVRERPLREPSPEPAAPAPAGARSFPDLCRRPFRLGRFSVDPRSLTASDGEDVHHLEPKVLLVLARLAASPGEVVMRDELFEAAWPGVHVGDNVLSRTISELRKLFDDRAAEPAAIETIRARGYRLLLPVNDAPAAPAAAASPRRRPRPLLLAAAGVLAVLALVALIRSTGALAPAATRPASTVRPVSTFDGPKWQPRISPGGESLVVVAKTDAMSSHGLLVKAIDDEAPRVFRDGPGEEDSPAWSPSGDEIAFVRRLEGTNRVLIAPRSGASERAVFAVATGVVSELDWSPDGRELAAGFRTGRNEPFSIARIAVDDGSLAVLSQPELGSLGHHTPRFSPDGERLAYVAHGLSRQSLVVMRRDGSGSTPVFSCTLCLAGFDWSPDGRSLVFSAALTEVRELWRVPAEGGEPERVVSGVVDVDEPTIARRGPSRLLVLSGKPDVNLWRQRIDRPDGRPEPVTRFTQPTFPQISNAGDRLAYARLRGGDSEILVASRAGREQRPLGLVPGRARHFSWSPGDRWIAFDVSRDGGSDVFVLAADGSGPPRPLAGGAQPEIDPTWSADGRFVYFSAFTGVDWTGWKVPIGGGEPLRVTDAPAYRVRESPDGETVYFSALLQPEIRSRPVAGGASVPVVSAREVAAGLWCVGREGLLVIALEDERDELFSVFRIDPATGEREPLTRIRGDLAGGEMAIDPDGWAYFVRVEHDRGELLLVEGFR